MKIIISILFFLLSIISTHAQPPTIGLILNSPEAVNGYTLFSSNQKTYLIDNCGFVINQWNSDFLPGISGYLLDDGSLIRAGQIQNPVNLINGRGGIIEKYDWEGNLLWNYTMADTFYHQHHDIAVMPNENVLLLVREFKSTLEALNMGRDITQFTNGLVSESIYEIERMGDSTAIVWEWHQWDHLIQDNDPNLPNYGVVSEHPERLDINAAPNIEGNDWLHANAITYNPELDQIAISYRNTNEIYIIDHSTTTEEAASSTGGNSGKGGDFLYRWGNPQVYERGTPDDQILFGQHDIKWIPPGYVNEGKLSVLNNGYQRPDTSYSSVEIWTPPVDENGNYTIIDDSAFGPSTTDWSYSDGSSFFSIIQSGADPLPNGNVLAHMKGRMIEITPDKEIVWDYINPQIGNESIPQGSDNPNVDIFRVTRYLENHSAFTDKDMTPGDPVELDPYPSTCEIYPTTSTLLIGEPIIGIQLLGNPFSDLLILENQGELELNISIFNIQGQKMASVSSQKNILKIPSSTWTSGLYLIFIHDLTTDNTFSIKVMKD